MKRAAWLLLALALAATRPAVAQDYHWEDLRIPMPAAGPRGLEAMLIRPAEKQAYPLDPIAMALRSTPAAAADGAAMAVLAGS